MVELVFDAAEFQRKAQERATGSEEAHKKDEPWIDDDDWVEADLPQRPWVAPGYVLRGAVTLLTGPPSALKSTLLLAWACAVALGKPHGPFLPTCAAPVIIYNVEDNRLEQRRRLSATLRQFNTTPTDIKGKVIRMGPPGVGTLFVLDEDGEAVPTLTMKKLRETIATRQPAMLIVDPFSELHNAEENANTAVRTIIAAFRALAEEFNIAIVIAHHTRKGGVVAGDPDSARGASAIIGAARIVLTLIVMSEEDAEALGEPTNRKHRARYSRLDDAKQNYAGIGDAVWFERKLRLLRNDELIPAAEPWEPPDMWEGVTVAVANAILDEINAGLVAEEGHRRYVHGGSAEDRAAWKVVVRHRPALTEKQAREIVGTYVKNGVLFHRKYYDPKDRKDRQGLYLNEARRPGAIP